MTFTEPHKVVLYALDSSKDLTIILESALNQIKSHEVERNHLQDALEKMIESELQDQKVLSSFTKAKTTSTST